MKFKSLSRMKMQPDRKMTASSKTSFLPRSSQGGILFLLICLTIICDTAGARVLKTEMQLVMPKQEIQNQAVAHKGSLEFAKESLTFSSEFPVELENIKMQFDYKITGLEVHSGGTFSAEVTLPAVQINIDSLKIDTVLEVENSGLRAKIPIKAACQGLQIQNSVPVVFYVQGQVQELPLLSLKMTAIDWQKSSKVWNLLSPECQAAPGFVSFLNEQLSKLWVSSGDLPNYLISDLNKEISAWFEKSLSFEKNVPELATLIRLTGQRFQETQEAWIFGIELQVDPHVNVEQKQVCPVLKNSVYLPGHSQNSNLTRTELWIPEKLVEVWARCLHERGLLKRQDRGYQIAGFQKLMNSRFAQFFVWQDLMRFDRRTDFHFMTSTYGNFRMTPVVQTRPTESVSYNLMTQVQSRMLYPDAGRWRPYVNFDTPLTTQLGLTVKDSKMSIRMIGAPRTQLQYRFEGPEETTWGKSIGISTVEKEVKSFLSTETYQIDLPRIDVTKGVRLEAQALRRENQTLKMLLKNVPAD